jgi:hypothetical protein
LDAEAEIISLREDVGGLKHDVNNLNGWQATQNGALLRMAEQVDSLRGWLMVVAGGLILNLLGIIFNLLKKGS